ncbi:hypothetical protein H6G89_06990 [Oscillatoria sp. FACHB-1407]|uniref:polysaccharide lyase n=1 Tax=Oscillatoria sp. FACHB-1407 TaxID=2692847 RepID=UPI0016875797|nr:hypothetical protein [Oscillatoria sp. FACHB-1407]MBD2460787.1 hypothetical protein [Oscillatoria sp. FACHB-1407]
MRFHFSRSVITYLILFGVALVITLTGCVGIAPRAYGDASPGRPSTDSADSPEHILWRSDFEQSNWLDNWQRRDRDSWGLENLEVLPDQSGQFSKVLRANYPAGSASPSVARTIGAPLGGGQFYGELGVTPCDALRLSYYVRFSDNFDFVKGGKLPGLFGGDGASGRAIPTGMDGFSTRYMWRRRGDGEVYAYLPTSAEHGTSLGRGNWRFRPGVWHHIEQEVVLNHPDQDDGRIRVWFDGDTVLDEEDVTFRRVDTLHLNGIFFSTFFGGGDPSWATPVSVYTDFADFVLYSVDVAPEIRPD